jgi:glutaredoxin
MKDTTKTIIIGVTITILVLILVIFILYKSDSKKLKNENPTNNYNNSTPTIKTDNNSNNEANTPSNNTEVNTTIKDDEKNSKIILYMFHGSTCPHCVNAIATIKEERNTTFKNVEIRTFEVWKNKDNSELYKKVTDKLKVNVNSIPYFVIGDYNRVGFNAEVLLKEYKKALNNKNYKDIVSEVIKENKDLKPVYETI